VYEQDVVATTKGNRGRIYDMVVERLQSLQDADPAGKTEADDADAARPFDWLRVIKEQEVDPERLRPPNEHVAEAQGWRGRIL
jgi:hypothetical protein